MRVTLKMADQIPEKPLIEGFTCKSLRCHKSMMGNITCHSKHMTTIKTNKLGVVTRNSSSTPSRKLFAQKAAARAGGSTKRNIINGGEEPRLSREGRCYYFPLYTFCLRYNFWMILSRDIRIYKYFHNLRVSPLTSPPGDGQTIKFEQCFVF